MKKRFSIKRYLKASVMLWVLIVSLVTTVWMYFDAKHEIDELFDGSLIQSAHILDNLLHLHPLDVKEQETNEIPNKVIKQLGVEVVKDEDEDQDAYEYEEKVAFQVWDKNNTLLFKSPSAPAKRFAVSKTGFHRAVINDHLWRTFSLYSEQNQWWLLVAESDEIRDELAGHIVRNHILPLIIGIPLLLLALHFLINKGLSPLHQIASQLKAKHHQDLSPIDDNDTPEEVLGLVDSLNGLFHKLETSYQRESRFSADAAHELRNPLAALMINTDNALEDTLSLQKTDLTSQNPVLEEHLNQQVKDLSNLKSGIKQLSHSVQQLLALSRAENQMTDEDYTEFSLHLLCHELSEQYETELNNKNQTLHIEVSEKDKVQGYKSLFAMMLSNLLSNTIKYSDSNSYIYLQSQTLENGSLNFIYEDTGPGIPEHEIVRVKDRFYRAQSINSSELGSGLGLSIVDAIITKHQGTWDISQSKKGGLKISINLPLNNKNV